jgi:hypothetical protein
MAVVGEQLQLMPQLSTSMAPLVAAWLRRSGDVAAALARWNLEPIPQLRMPPPHSGIKIKVPFFRGVGKNPTVFEVKLRGMHGVEYIDDRVILQARDPHWLLHDCLVRQVRESEKRFGYMAHPRNYYLTDSLEVHTGEHYGPDGPRTYVMWKCWWVVMPKSWRKKLWKARQRG